MWPMGFLLKNKINELNWLIDWLIDWIVFYAESAIVQQYNGDY